MNASCSVTAPRHAARRRCKGVAPLAVIVFLHALLLYALQRGLPHTAAQAMPREIRVSLVAPAPARPPEMPKPAPAAPKTVPVIHKPVPRPAPATPIARPAPLAPPVEASPTPATAPSIDRPAPPAAAAAAPTVTAAPAVPKTVSGVAYIQAPQPVYPPIARRMGEEGTVLLRILVNEHGRPERIDVRQSSGSARLDAAASQAASHALFKPHLEDGQAVAVYALVPINFSIQ